MNHSFFLLPFMKCAPLTTPVVSVNKKSRHLSGWINNGLKKGWGMKRGGNPFVYISVGSDQKYLYLFGI